MIFSYTYHPITGLIYESIQETIILNLDNIPKHSPDELIKLYHTRGINIASSANEVTVDPLVQIFSNFIDPFLENYECKENAILYNILL